MAPRSAHVPENHPLRHSRESGNPVWAVEPRASSLGSRFRGNDGKLIFFENSCIVLSHSFTSAEGILYTA
jgi:hypothetical protein